MSSTTTDELLDVFRRGKLKITLEGAQLFHAFLPKSTTLQLSAAVDREIARYHLRIFVDKGEFVFLVADQDAPERTPARHPWAVRVPIAESLHALERERGGAYLEKFRELFAQSLCFVTKDGAKPPWILVGMFDAGSSFADAPFDGDTTQLALESANTRARFISGEDFCAAAHEDGGVVVEQGADGAPVVRWLAYPPPAGAPEWIAAVLVEVVPVITATIRFGADLLETVRPIVQPRTTFPLPDLPDPQVIIDGALETLHRHLRGWRSLGRLPFPWDAHFESAP